MAQDLREVTGVAKWRIPKARRGRKELLAHDTFQEQLVESRKRISVVSYLTQLARYLLLENHAPTCHIPGLRKGAKIEVNDAISPEPAGV